MTSISAPSVGLPIDAFRNLPGTGQAAARPAAGEDPTVKEFMDYVNMTPAQKMRASYLSGMGLTEDDLAKMSAEERQKVEDKIKQMIKAELEKGDKDHKGMLVDVTA